MKKFCKKVWNKTKGVVVAVGVGIAAALGVSKPALAVGTLTMPTIDLTDFYAAVTLILGVAVAVLIVRRVRGQIR